jgi:hypothetical protein
MRRADRHDRQVVRQFEENVGIWIKVMNASRIDSGEPSYSRIGFHSPAKRPIHCALTPPE